MPSIKTMAIAFYGPKNSHIEDLQYSVDFSAQTRLHAFPYFDSCFIP
jgi:hypothetical protein